MLGKIVDILIKLLIFLTFALVILALIKPELFIEFIKWVEGVVITLGYWNYLIIFISGLIEGFPVLGVAVPGQNILMIVGGFFGNMSTLNLILSIVVASMGAILSNGIGYILGRYYGESFFKKYGLWFGIGETEIKYLKKGIKKWGPTSIVLGKFHNLARAFVPFIAGTMKMEQKLFWIYNTIGSIIWATTIVTLGIFFAEHYEVIIKYFGYILIGLMVLIGLYIWKYKKKGFKKYMKEKNEEIERKL